MRRFVHAFYLMALLALVGCQPPGPKSLLEGERLMREGKYAEAIPKLQKATELLPGNAQAWNHLGLACQYAGKPDEALRAYQQAVSLDRNLPVIRFNLGNLYLEQNRLNEAIAELTTCTVLQSTNVEAFVLLGKAQLRAKRIDDAEKSFVSALRLEKNNVEALNYYGVVQLHRRKAKDALAYFNEALKQDPNYGPAMLNLAILYQHYIVDKPKALANYRNFLATKPDGAGAAAASEAARALEAELAPKVVINTNPPPALIVTNRPVAAITNLPATNKVMAAVHTNHPAHTNKPIVAAVKTNEPVKTLPPPLTNKTEVAVAPPPPPKTNVIVAVAPPAKTNEVKVAAVVTAPPPAEIEKPKPEPVKEPEPEKVVETPKPLEVVNVNEDAIVIAPAKDVPKPKVETPKVVEPPKTNEVKVAAKAPEPIAVTNKVQEEPPPLIRPVQREERSSSSLLKKANPLNWFKRGEKEEKVEVTPEKKPEKKVADIKTLPEPPRTQPQPEPQPAAPKIEPEPVYARYPYRKAPLPSAGNREAALASFNTGFKAHQDNKLGTAMDSYREALRIDPRFFEAQLNLGIAAASANDLSLALAALEDAVRLDPKSVEARYQFAIVLRRANYPQDAVNELKTVLEQEPTEARAYLALGNIYAQIMNKPELAAANYQKTLELAPQHPQGPQIRAWLAQH